MTVREAQRAWTRLFEAALHQLEISEAAADAEAMREQP